MDKKTSSTRKQQDPERAALRAKVRIETDAGEKMARLAAAAARDK